MAMKRSLEDEVDHISCKRLHIGDSNPRLESFLSWCNQSGLDVSKKVRVGKDGSCAQYGMVAVEDIKEGECVFEIPRELLLTPATSQISNILCSDDGLKSLQSDSGWVPLLVALMYEYTSPTSKWTPYVRLVPDFDQLDLPMFWDSKSRTLLHNIGIDEAVSRDEKNITKEFYDIVLPFIEKHSDVFSQDCRSLDLYKKMVAFVMSYSFTEPPIETEDDDEEDGEEVKNPPMMVPMADILNHIAKNNAHLDFGKDSLKMVATKDIKQGEEVFNTYGELANGQLLHMYGFAEAYPENVYDTVDLPTNVIPEIMKSGESEDTKLFEKKWKFLSEMGLASDDGSFVVGVDGILTEEEVMQTLKILAMDDAQFKECEENEGWVEEEDDSNEELSFENLPSLPLEMKNILAKIGKAAVLKYGSESADIEDTFTTGNWRQFQSREKYVFLVKYGQTKLLHKMIAACESDDTNCSCCSA